MQSLQGSGAAFWQLRVVGGILKRVVFVVLPTGFGKSACYQCLPLLYGPLSIVVVVTPLTAIMKDQVSLASYPSLASLCSNISIGSQR